MTEQQLVDYLLSLPCTEEDYPFGKEIPVYKVFGKVFAIVGYRDGKVGVNLKALPENVSFLSEEFTCIERGYHMNKKHWITLYLTEEITQSMVEGWVDDSYQLVCAKLTKAQKMNLAKVIK